MLWINRFLSEIGVKQEYVVHYDSQSAIHLSKNFHFHSSKHIYSCYHWIRDMLENKLLKLSKIHTEKNILDMMTKSIFKNKQIFCRNGACMQGASYTA